MSYVTSGVWESLKALLLCGLLTWSVCRTGQGCLAAMRLDARALSPREHVLFCFAAGTVLIGHAVLLAGLAGWLQAPLIAALFAAGAVWGVLTERRDPLLGAFGSIDAAGRACLLIASAAIALASAPALAPPTGNDALAYHLAYPKTYLEMGRVAHLAYTWESLWPAQTEMFFLVGLLFAGTSLAQLFHWIYYPFLALLAYCFTERHWGKPAARAAGLVVVLTPAAFAQAGCAYVDLALAFFAGAAFYAYSLRGTLGEGRAALLSGLFAGGALATKYLALGTSGLLGVFWAARSSKRARNAALYASAALAVGAIWYLRSWIQLGNPVFPFFHTVFGSGFEVVPGRALGFDKGLIGFLLLGWNSTMHPERFGGTMMSPLPLIFLPMLLPAWKRSRPVSRELFIYGTLTTAFLFAQAQQNRFFLVLLPWLAVGTGVAITRQMADTSSALRRCAALVLLIWTVAAFGIFTYRSQKAWGVVAGIESAASYLSRSERSFRGYQYLERNSSAQDRVFNHGDNRRFFARDGQVVWNEDILRGELATQARTIDAYLREQGFDFLWVNQYSDPAIYDYLERNGYQKVFSYDFTEGGFLYQHQIFRRPNPSRPS